MMSAHWCNEVPIATASRYYYILLLDFINTVPMHGTCNCIHACTFITICLVNLYYIKCNSYNDIYVYINLPNVITACILHLVVTYIARVNVGSR